MKKTLMIIYLGLLGNATTAQISSPGTPYGIKENSYSKNLIQVKFQQPDLKSLEAEDAVTDQHKDIPWRFGIAKEVSLNTAQHGTWMEIDGGKLWQLELYAPGAVSINLNYRNFEIPEGGKFFIYGKNTHEYIGAFTSDNNKDGDEFATGLIHDESVILEYYEPHDAPFNGTIDVSSLVYGYRAIKFRKDFGDSGDCNNNMACFPEWQEEGNAVAMLLTSSNTRFCTGALVNNVREDKTPYFLTANHCGPSGNNIFMFNYQSPNCSPNSDGNTSNTVSGCTVMAQNSPSDFALVKLNSSPPESYNATYAGWSAINTPAQSVTGIHHPSGDTKKITFRVNPVIDDPDEGGTHWLVPDWDDGTTEGGSSGSPLYDQNRRIVGQLHGGWAACGNDEYDTYGAFFYSWDADPDSDKQLKHWLDPDNTGIKVLDALGSFEPADSLELDVLGLNGISGFLCGENFTPSVDIRNKGISAITSISFDIKIDGNSISSYSWNGNLESGGYETITLDEIDALGISNGNHSISVTATFINGGADANTDNNSKNKNFFNNANPQTSTLTVRFDNWPSESSWKIFDKDNPDIIIPSNGSGGVGETIEIPLCTYEGCFVLEFYDSFGDGICCGEGEGYFMITNSNDTLVLNQTFSGSLATHEFCVGPVGIAETLAGESIQVFPNPSTGILRIMGIASSEMKSLSVIDVNGVLVKNAAVSNQLDLSDLAKGIYFVRIQTEDTAINKKIVLIQ